jgi:hypothetical protein
MSLVIMNFLENQLNNGNTKYNINITFKNKPI